MLDTKPTPPGPVTLAGPSKALFPGGSAKVTLQECSEAPSNAERVVTVLAVSRQPEDHLDLREIFQHSRWQLYHAHGFDDALDILDSHHIPVIIADCSMKDRCWQELLDRLSTGPKRPAARLIVTSRVADDRLWSEVLNLGAYNVLAKPFEPKEVFWVVSHAWLDWKRELERPAFACSAAGAQ